MPEKTIREIGGEVWSEIAKRKWSNEKDAIASIDDSAVSPLIELVMAVLARHEGVTLVNDGDLPVEPLKEE